MTADRNKNPSKTGIRDVAEAAGVSRTAVSLVLNDEPIRISDEKRKRIIEVARAMNYVPHIGARRLAIRRTETLGLVLPAQASAFTDEDVFDFTHHCAAIASESGYDLLIHFYDNAEHEKSARTADRADGSIVVLSRDEGPAVADIWAAAPQPHIIIGGGGYASPPAQFVDIDIASGIAATTRHVIQLGHRNIAYINSASRSEKINGYLVALTRAGLPVRREWIFESGLSDAALNKTADDLLAMPERPTALVCTSDALAARMMRMLRARGFDLPRDFSITGHDNLDIANLVEPGLTSARMPVRRMARLAVAQLIALVEKQPVRALQTTLSAELVPRASTVEREGERAAS